jgi:hypothetical protein
MPRGFSVAAKASKRVGGMSPVVPAPYNTIANLSSPSALNPSLA